MKTLGLDISYTRTGVVLLESVENDSLQQITLIDSFAMKFPPATQRLAKAYASISSEFAPGRRPHFDAIDLVIIEDPIYGVVGRNSRIIPTASIKLAELSAIFKLFLEVRNMSYLTVSPTGIKRFITGRGDAEKGAVAAEIKRRFGISFEKDTGNDLSDACALALWGVLTKGS